jgi:hypothetical protein
VAALADPAEVRLHLVAAAKAGTALSYAELLERLGFTFSRPKMRALCALLGTVDAEAEARGEPELAVLVVRQSDGIPGQGWWVAGGAAFSEAILALGRAPRRSASSPRCRRKPSLSGSPAPGQARKRPPVNHACSPLAAPGEA